MALLNEEQTIKALNVILAADTNKQLLVTSAGAKCGAAAECIGVTKFDGTAGDAVAAVTGIRKVTAGGAISAGGAFTGSSGKAIAATEGSVVHGIAITAATTDGDTILAYVPGSIPSSDVGLEAVDLSFGCPVGAIADTAAAYVGGTVVQNAITVSAVVAYTQNTCADAEDHIVIDLYKISSGTATKIWSVTTAADWTDAGLAMAVETDMEDLAAGDVLYALITNETGSSITPNVVVFDLTAALQ